MHTSYYDHVIQKNKTRPRLARVLLNIKQIFFSILLSVLCRRVMCRQNALFLCDFIYYLRFLKCSITDNNTMHAIIVLTIIYKCLPHCIFFYYLDI